MTVLRSLAKCVGALVVVLIGIALVARLSDGPIGPFAGGTLLGGVLVPDSTVDWSFARDIDTVEFQLLDPARSRTVWILVRDGELYIPCQVPEFRLWKQWPHEALEDGRAVIRVDGKRYPVRAVRVTDPKLLEQVGTVMGEKYLDGSVPETGSVWVFRMDPRTGRDGAEGASRSVEPARARYSPMRPKLGGRRS
ncbi:MAG: hypothetical protein HRU00_03080 [Myxococcales bacterium]|nr:hypothetical protein [Myxococcales bacterium]